MVQALPDGAAFAPATSVYLEKAGQQASQRHSARQRPHTSSPPIRIDGPPAMAYFDHGPALQVRKYRSTAGLAVKCPEVRARLQNGGGTKDFLRIVPAGGGILGCAITV